MKQPFRVNEVAYWIVEDAEGVELLKVTVPGSQESIMRKARLIAVALNRLPAAAIDI